MGLFDTVWMQCPHCHRKTSEQTKNGPCSLNNYELNENMEATLGVIGDHYCEHCHKLFTVELETRPVAVIRD